MAVKLSKYARRVQKWYAAGWYDETSLEQLLQAGKITKKEMEAIKASKKE
jgi:hypothetical protein